MAFFNIVGPIAYVCGVIHNHGHLHGNARASNRFRMTGMASNRAVPSCIEENYHIMQICARSATLPAKNSRTTRCSLAVWKKGERKSRVDFRRERERERESRWTVTHLRGRHVIQWNGNTIYSPIPSIRGNEKRKSDIRVRTISSGRRSNDLSYVRYFTLRPVSARMNGSFAKIVSSRVKKSNEVNVNVFQRVRARRSPLPNCAKKFHQSSIIRRLLLSSHQGEGWERLAIRSEAE